MKTFPIGGVHPHDYKISAQKAIENAPIPAQVSIFLSQHIGAPASAIVAKGDKVKVGQVIAEAAGFISAPVHSSVSGTVKAVELVKDGGGLRKMAVVIKVEGDEWDENIDRSEELKSECTLEPKEIIERVKAAGIVGLGGATFPTNVKLCPPPGKTAEFLVVNGVECEPYLTADHRLMLERADEFLVGCKIVMRALGVKKCYVGIENNKPDAIALLSSKASDGVEIIPLKVQYPQGGEKQLIAAVSGREVPSGALPIEVGAVVQNVGTIVAIYEAVQKNKPLFERITTVTGDDVPEPKNLKVRLGTPISELLALAKVEGGAKVINGGPMMGRAMANVDAPTTKGTSGVLVMPQRKALRPKENACIACAKCVSVCPMGLEPYLLSKIGKLGLSEKALSERAQDCIECGCCSFTCPAGVPILDYVRLAKGMAMVELRKK
ncbi:MAG: electron transport complex subunit RsxC [Rikenellaceae bacterium]